MMQKFQLSLRIYSIAKEQISELLAIPCKTSHNLWIFIRNYTQILYKHHLIQLTLLAL